jgi:hypothetical protein
MVATSNDRLRPKTAIFELFPVVEAADLTICSGAIHCAHKRYCIPDAMYQGVMYQPGRYK